MSAIRPPARFRAVRDGRRPGSRVWSRIWRDHIRDALRTRLWPVPAIGVFLAIAAGLGLPALDQVVDPSLPEVYPMFASTMDDARDLLGSISTGVMTVTSLTFSLTVVALQLASAQYSPRLLRTFAGDRFVQVTMALFLATFAYSITVLHNARNGPGSSAGAVPQVSVAFAAVLALVSVIQLVFFFAHLVREIRVETIIFSVAGESLAAGRRVFEPLDSTKESGPVPQPPQDAALIEARSTGFVVGIDEDDLVAAAERADAVVVVTRSPGDWVVAGSPLAYAWAAGSAGALAGDRLHRLREGVLACVRTAIERTPVQDVGYGLRQLTDVVVKALSPAVNDPTTAVHAIGNSSAVLCELTRRRLDYKTLRVGEVTRAVIREPSFSELLDLAVAQPRRYGAEDPLLLARLFDLLREVAWHANAPDHKAAIEGQLARLRRTVSRQDFDETECEGLEALGRDVEAVLAGDRRPRVGEPR